MRQPHEVLGIAPNATGEEALQAYRRKEIYMNPKNFEEGSQQRKQAEASMNELQEALDAFTNQAMPSNTESTAGEEKTKNWRRRLPALGVALGMLGVIGYPGIILYSFFCFLFYGKLAWFILALLLFLFISWNVMGFWLRRVNIVVNIICVILLGIGGYMLCSLPFGMFIAGQSLSFICVKTGENLLTASIAGRVLHGFFRVTSRALIYVGIMAAIYLNFIR